MSRTWGSDGHAGTAPRSEASGILLTRSLPSFFQKTTSLVQLP